MSTALSVNLNKIAVLRNSRGGGEPDVVRAGIACLDAGAHGLTVHPRPDARHIRADDVHALAALCHARGVEFNIEGNPFASPRPGYPGLLALCAAARPAQVTLVPDSDGQLTSDHGFDFVRDGDGLRPLVAAFKVGNGEGVVQATATAFDMTGTPRGRNTGSTTIRRGQTTEVLLVLDASAVGMQDPPDGGTMMVMDGALPDVPMLLPDAGVDAMIDGAPGDGPGPDVATQAELMVDKAIVEFGTLLQGMSSAPAVIKVTNVGGDVSGADFASDDFTGGFGGGFDGGGFGGGDFGGGF